MTDTTTHLREQLLALRRKHEAGALDAATFEARKTALERKLLDAVLAAPPAAPAPLPEPSATRHPSAVVWAGVAAAVVAVAGIGYGLTGSSGEIGQAPAGFTAAQGGGPESAGDGAATAPHAMDRAQMEAMVAKLAERMQAQPDNVEGWGILGRSYMAMGRAAEALSAYGRALKLKPDDATLMVDYADALGVKNGNSLDGEPAQLIARALQLEPDNIKALALAGTVAFNRGDYATAVKHWDHAVKTGPADNGLVEMSRNGAAEARERGKLPAAAAATAKPAGPVQAQAATSPATAAAAAAPAITGTVRLAAALKGQTAPEDTVFIFARAAEGSRMPLAIVRMQVKDLPAQFKLDDSLALSAATKLSAAKRVIVGARISKSGQATPQPGDLQGLSAPVDVGAAGVTVEIATKVP